MFKIIAYGPDGEVFAMEHHSNRTEAEQSYLDFAHRQEIIAVLVFEKLQGCYKCWLGAYK